MAMQKILLVIHDAFHGLVLPAIPYPPAKGSQPFLLDLHGNMKPVLLGATQTNPFTQWLFDGNNNLYIWIWLIIIVQN